jgi:hypothetical protein
MEITHWLAAVCGQRSMRDPLHSFEAGAETHITEAPHWREPTDMLLAQLPAEAELVRVVGTFKMALPAPVATHLAVSIKIIVPV